MRAAGGIRDEGDRFLVARIAEGDPEAFRQLVDRYSGRLKAFAARLLAGTGLEPEDAVQETFLALVRALDRLPRVRSLQAYLFGVTRNKAVDLIRGSPEAHGIRVRAFGPGEGGEPLAPGETPSARVGRQEIEDLREQVLTDALEEVVEGLKAERRLRNLKVLELVFYRSWTSRDAARAVGTSEPTVSRIRGRAIARLAAIVARGTRVDPASGPAPSGELVGRLWRENLLSCLKRSTLGAHELGVLEPPWAEHVAFHLEVVGCEACEANLADLREGASEEARRARERIFQSSAGFLRRRGGGGKGPD